SLLSRIHHVATSARRSPPAVSDQATVDRVNLRDVDRDIGDLRDSMMRSASSTTAVDRLGRSGRGSTSMASWVTARLRLRAQAFSSDRKAYTEPSLSWTWRRTGIPSRLSQR